MSDKAIISYVPQIECKWRKFDENEKITHDKLNTFKFSSRSLFEVIDDKVDNVRLFFDFDEADTCEQVEAIIDFLDNLVDQCGKYALAGYTTNESMRDIINVRYIPFDELDKQVKAVSGHKAKTFSCHAVFYQSRVNAKQLKAVMSTINDYDISEDVKIDNSVYKFPRLFRHPYSDKVYKPGKTIKNAGTSPFKDSADKLVITCDGNETIDVNANWLFDLKESTTEQQQDQQTTEQPHDDNKPATTNTTTTKQETKMTPELFKALYEGFNGLEVHGENADVKNEISLYPLLASLFACKNEVINEFLIDDALMFIKRNTKLTENAKAKWCKIRNNAEVKPSQGPGQLFNYLKQFNPEYYNNKIKPLVQPVTYEFNVRDSFTLADIERLAVKGHYQVNGDINVFDYNKLLNDLKRVLVVVNVGHEFFVLKVFNCFTGKNTICFMPSGEAHEQFSKINVGTKANKKGNGQVYVSIWDVYNAGFNKVMFKKQGIRFFSENKNVFSFFQGYDYVKTDKIDNELIAPFLEHIKSVWCSNDAHLFNYINTWFASILQNPNMKTKIALVVKGKEGSGKNTITDVWCELLGCYANSNITNIDEIVGKFNTTLENKKLIVLNEMASVDSNKYMNADIMKALITEQKVMINEKGVKAREGENVANFIIVSNNLNPVRITSNDRRYCVIKTTDSVIGNFDYFKRIHELVEREDFKQSLFNYYMSYDIHTVDLRMIPETEERMIMKKINRLASEVFVNKYAKMFNEGFGTKECRAYYDDFCRANKYSAMNLENFEAAISVYAIKERRRVGNTRIMRWWLKDSYKHWVDEQNEEEDEYIEEEEQQEPEQQTQKTEQKQEEQQTQKTEQKQEEQQTEQKQEEAEDDDEPFDPTTALNKLLGLI